MAASTQTSAEMGAADSSTVPEILAAITACKESLTTKIDYLTVDVGLIRQDLDKFQSWISKVEERVSTVEDTVRTDSMELKALQIQVKALQERAINTKNRLRRNNICILGPPERAEGPRPKSSWPPCSILLTSLPHSWWREPTGSRHSLRGLGPQHTCSCCEC